MNKNQTDQISLNKYVSQSGLCSRKKATELVKSGLITINHAAETNPLYKIQKKDTVRHNKKELKPAPRVYILLNKPKNHITTKDDEKGRKTVLDLIHIKNNHILHPVGRLDKDTTGVLILTSDGQLTQKLAHPKFNIKKVYKVALQKPITLDDFKKIQKGLHLEDGFIKPDKIFVSPKSENKIVNIEIHSGKNHVVRRIFKAMCYNIRKLDRISLAGITTKGLKLGYWRFLEREEIEDLYSL